MLHSDTKEPCESLTRVDAYFTPVIKAPVIVFCTRAALLFCAADETERELKMLRRSPVNKELGHVIQRFVRTI